MLSNAYILMHSLLLPSQAGSAVRAPASCGGMLLRLLQACCKSWGR